MNKMKLGLIAAALMALTTSAFADTSTGPYVGIGIGGYEGTNKLTASGLGSVTLGSSSLDFSGNVFGGYNWNFGAGSVAGEVSYNSNVGKLDQISDGTSSFDGKLEQNWQVSILPGYNFTKSTEGYVRLGWTQAKGNISGNVGGVPGSFDHTFNGWVVGLGVDEAVTPNVAVRLEWQYLNFSSFNESGSEWEPRSTGVNLSLRYGF